MDVGIDEAGRGPVLGPLVVAGVRGDSDAAAALGVKDSKKLTPANRQRLARLIRNDFTVDVRVIEAPDLDLEMAASTLNEVVLARFQAIAGNLAGARTVVDAADVDADRFGRRIQEVVAGEVVSQHKADANHPIVAAASIIAKTVRDDAMEELSRRLERRLPMPLGSGYPSDPITIRFITAWLDEFGDMPEGTRRRWKTTARLLAEHRVQPTRLDDF